MIRVLLMWMPAVLTLIVLAESFASVCQAMGAFNHLGPADLKCQPDKMCFTGNPSLVQSPSLCTSQGGSVPYRAQEIGKNTSGVTEYLCTLCREDL